MAHFNFYLIMRTIISILFTAITVSIAQAQTLKGNLDYDLTEIVEKTVNGEDHTMSPILVKTLAIGDYVTFNFTIPSFTAAPNTDADTVELEFRPIFQNQEDGVSGAQITVAYPFNTTIVSDASGTGTGYQIPAYQKIKFREDSVYTVTITNTGATTVKFDWYNIVSNNGSIISNLGSDLFEEGKVSLNNPVLDGDLTISLVESIKSITLELISMEGISVISKTITTTDNNIDVSGLKTGLYLLRDINSGSVTKLMIK